MENVKLKDLFCNLCALQFHKKSIYDIHMSFLHGNIKIQKEVETELQIDEVQDVNKPVQERNSLYICPFCDRNFTIKQNLNRHIASVHEGKKPFKCNNCEASFSEKQHVKRHIQSVHKGKGTFQGKKTVKCTICDANFTRREHMKRHVISIHMGNRSNITLIDV